MLLHWGFFNLKDGAWTILNEKITFLPPPRITLRRKCIHVIMDTFLANLLYFKIHPCTFNRMSVESHLFLGWIMSTDCELYISSVHSLTSVVLNLFNFDFILEINLHNCKHTLWKVWETDSIWIDSCLEENHRVTWFWYFFTVTCRRLWAHPFCPHYCWSPPCTSIVPGVFSGTL